MQCSKQRGRLGWRPRIGHGELIRRSPTLPRAADQQQARISKKEPRDRCSFAVLHSSAQRLGLAEADAVALDFDGRGKSMRLYFLAVALLGIGTRS